MLLEDIGSVIKTYRSRLGFTQNDLAAALQISAQAVSKWERGENAPDIAMLPQLSEILGVSIDTLLCSNWRDQRTVAATVLFADLQDFSSLACKQSAADLAISLNTFFYPLTEQVMAQDGLPVKYIGDELLAVFIGAQHQLRAFRAVFAARRSQPFTARYTLASGQVWMGSIGHPLYARLDILGDTVNMASVLQKWAKTKTTSLVAASASAIEPVRAGLRLGFSETLSVLGAGETTEVYEVLALDEAGVQL